MTLLEYVKMLLRFPYYLKNYYGQYWYRARIGLMDVIYLWKTIEGE